MGRLDLREKYRDEDFVAQKPPYRQQFWVSSAKMTVGFTAEDGVIIEAAPIIRKFIGQRTLDLIHWMQKQGNLRYDVKVIHENTIGKK